VEKSTYSQLFCGQTDMKCSGKSSFLYLKILPSSQNLIFIIRISSKNLQPFNKIEKIYEFRIEIVATLEKFLFLRIEIVVEIGDGFCISDTECSIYYVVLSATSA